MKQYLVLGRCGMDDIPLWLFTSEAAAEAFIKGLGREDVIKAAYRVLGVGVSDVLFLDVVEFENGCPKRSVTFRDLEEK